MSRCHLDTEPVMLQSGGGGGGGEGGGGGGGDQGVSPVRWMQLAVSTYCGML